jgi:hypothetical protein
MKTTGGGGRCVDPRFLSFGISWKWVVSFPPLSLYTKGKSPRYPLDKRLHGPQNRSGRNEEMTILDSTGTRTPDPSIVQLVASSYTYCTNVNKWIHQLKLEERRKKKQENCAGLHLKWYLKIMGTSSRCLTGVVSCGRGRWRSVNCSGGWKRWGRY